MRWFVLLICSPYRNNVSLLRFDRCRKNSIECVHLPFIKYAVDNDLMPEFLSQHFPGWNVTFKIYLYHSFRCFTEKFPILTSHDLLNLRPAYPKNRNRSQDYRLSSVNLSWRLNFTLEDDTEIETWKKLNDDCWTQTKLQEKPRNSNIKHRFVFVPSVCI